MGIIGRDGSVENAKVMSGPESMGEVALRAVRGWSYRPYLMDGVPVEIETTMRVNFGS
jgi:protein TonB